eukprot:TRINITY_DN2526_c0_g1_i1.p1 TRINITY_DN2526_c0_g1~~TRINITY_DN2526_c0_g1_i1.p1  ORF type:complete len:310 (-),score=35.39 TRINITY_DN2526_c0_g1_i1:63-920(-)
MQHGFVVVTVAVAVAFLSGCGRPTEEEEAREFAQDVDKCVQNKWANMIAVRSKTETCSPEYGSATRDGIHALFQCCEPYSGRFYEACYYALEDIGVEANNLLIKECPPPEEIASRNCVNDRKQKLIAIKNKSEKRNCEIAYAKATYEFANKLDECCKPLTGNLREDCFGRVRNMADHARHDWVDFCGMLQIDLTEKSQPLFDSVPETRGFEQINSTEIPDARGFELIDLTERLQALSDSVPHFRDLPEASFTRTNVGVVALVVAGAGAAGAAVALAITSLKTRRQ